jgi:hypothetical protein
MTIFMLKLRYKVCACARELHTRLHVLLRIRSLLHTQRVMRARLQQR